MLTTSFPRFNGDLSGIFIYHLAKNLVKRGIGVSVVCPHSPGCLSDEIVDGIKVHRFTYLFPTCLEKVAYRSGIPTNLKTNLLLWLELPFFIIFYLFKGIKFCCYSFIIKSMKPEKEADVIHAHWIFCGAIGVILKILFHRPLIITERGSSLKIALKSPILTLIYKSILGKCNIITANSIHQSEKIKKLGFKNVSFIPNGINTELFRERPKEQIKNLHGLENINLKNCRVILFVGSLIPRKKVNDLIEAYYQIQKTEKKLFLVLIGDGYLKKNFKKTCITLGILNKVLFLGRLHQNIISRFMNISEFLVLPSKYEGRPNVIGEALASGLPVIASDIPGNNELVKHNVNGLFFESGNVKELKNRMKLLLIDEKFRKKLACNARKTIIEKGLLWTSVAEKYSRIYSNLIKDY